MPVFRYQFIREFLLCVLLASVFSENARAQVMIDVSKISCNQFVTYKIENPKYIVA